MNVTLLPSVVVCQAYGGYVVRLLVYTQDGDDPGSCEMTGTTHVFTSIEAVEKAVARHLAGTDSVTPEEAESITHGSRVAVPFTHDPEDYL